MLTLGADVELIVVKNKEPVSAIPYLDGTKYNPEPVLKGALQHDGVLAEFNIDPASTAQEFVHNTTTVMSQLSKHLAKHNLNYSVVPHAVYSQEYLNNPEACESGCDPDYNAYLESINPKPLLENTTMRTCGGHVHFGIPESMQSVEGIRKLIMLCDLHLGLPSLLLDSDGIERRKLFGKASCFRMKPYGFEYRTLSNFWVKTPELIEWVFNQATAIMSMLNDKNRSSFFSEGTYDAMHKIINMGESKAAMDYIHHFKVKMPHGY